MTHEISEQLPPRLRALFRMKLAAEYIVLSHDGRHIAAVRCGGDQVLLAFEHHPITVHEIEVGGIRNSAQEFIPGSEVNFIPSDMRNSQRASQAVQPPHLARDERQ